MVVAAAPRYEVVCRLAGGGMADLHLARAVAVGGFERLVVVKRLTAELQSNPAMVQALFDEARIAATLQHQNIVQVNDVEVVDGQVSIVMEYLHGHDMSHLAKKLAKRGELVPIDQAIAISAGTCAGLHHAHERVGPDGKSLAIVHRDISPHNIFVTFDGSVKIVDFGIARATTRKGHTEHGVIKGKPGYIAPEQVRGRQIDRRTDIWATGVLLYEMTTGNAPFGPGGVAFDQLVAVVTEDPPPPMTHVPDYPPELSAIVMKAMARDMEARYQTAEEMRADLERFARARKLDLSPGALVALMERVYSTQLRAWREAQKSGRSLADHMQALHETVELSIAGLDTDERLSAKTEVRPSGRTDERLERLAAEAAFEVDAEADAETVALGEPPERPSATEDHPTDLRSPPPSAEEDKPTALRPPERPSVSEDKPTRLRPPKEQEEQPTGRRGWRIAVAVIGVPGAIVAGMLVWSLLDAKPRALAGTPQDEQQVTPPTPSPVRVEPIIEPETGSDAAVVIQQAVDAAVAVPETGSGSDSGSGSEEVGSDEGSDATQHTSPFTRPPKRHDPPVIRHEVKHQRVNKTPETKKLLTPTPDKKNPPPVPDKKTPPVAAPIPDKKTSPVATPIPPAPPSNPTDPDAPLPR